MTKSVLRFVTLATFMTMLIAPSPLTPAFAMGGGAGTGAGGYPSSLMRLDPPDRPSPQTGPAHIKPTHKIKRITRHSSIRQPGT